MILSSLSVNQLSASASAWYLERYLPALDSLDVAAYGAFLDEAVAMQFNNGPPVAGKAAVLGMLSQFWSSFASLEHEPLRIYGTDGAFMLEALNHYVRHDGRRVITHAVALTDRDETGAVTSVRVFADASPVFAP